MSTSENLYEISNDAVAILRKRFLFHTDNNFCAAFILDNFVATIASREEHVWRNKELVDYHIYVSIRRLTAGFFGLFTEQDVIDALNLLIEKKLIGNHGKIQESERYNFEIYRARIDALSEEYRANIRRKREIDEAKRQANEITSRTHPLPPPPQPTPEEIERQRQAQIIAREMDRVKSHIARARRVGLPATLTLDEWLAALDHFEWRCAYCGESYDLLEHYIPLSHYAGTTQANCVPACHRCNGVKQSWHPDRIPPSTNKCYAKLQNGLARVREYLESFREVE